MKPCIIYAAKSTEDKRGSLGTQITDCHSLAEREGWQVVGTFQDEAFSAYSGNRGPGLEQAKALAASTAAVEGVCILVAQDADRFARGAGDAPGAAEHVGEVYFAMKRQNVELWTVRSGRLDLLRAAFEGERSHDESARKSQSVKAGIERSVRDRGGTSGGPRPYGYRYSGDKNDPGRLVVIPYEAEIVRRMFSEYLAGRAQSAIARGLLDDRVPTRKGGRWGQSTVSRILKNPLYIGKVTLAGNVYEGKKHEPIIEAEVFQKVQDLFAARSTQKPGRPTTGLHLFRKGMLRCGNCGWALSPRNDGRRQYYYCTGHRQLGREYCSLPYLKREYIDLPVYDYFNKAALDVDATRRQMAGARDSKLAELKALAHSAELAERRTSEAVIRVKRDYLRGAISAEDWAGFQVDLEEEQAGAAAELRQHQDQLLEVESWGIAQDAEQDTLQKLFDIRSALAGEVQDAEGLSAVRAALLRLFEHFVVHVDGSEGRIEAVVREGAWTSVAEELESGELIAVPILRPTALDLGGEMDPWPRPPAPPPPSAKPRPNAPPPTSPATATAACSPSSPP